MSGEEGAALRWETLARRAYFLLAQPDTSQKRLASFATPEEVRALAREIPPCNGCGTRYEILNSEGMCVDCSTVDVGAALSEANALLVKALAALNDENEGEFTHSLHSAKSLLNDVDVLAARW